MNLIVNFMLLKQVKQFASGYFVQVSEANAKQLECLRYAGRFEACACRHCSPAVVWLWILPLVFPVWPELSYCWHELKTNENLICVFW